MVMSRADAEAIVQVVVNDPESTKRISSYIDGIVPASWGIAGTVRNTGYVLGWMATFGHWGDASEKEFADRVCTGISQATTAAIQKAIRSGDARLHRFRQAVGVDRTLNGTAHSATGVITIGGSEHVFDWHATLDERNPLVFRSLIDWKNGGGGIPFADFKGWVCQA